MNKKVGISITIDSNNYDYFKNKGINISEWINNRMERELKSKEDKIKELEQDINKKRLEIEQLKKELNEDRIKLDKIKNNLTKEQINEIKESIEMIKDRVYLFEGRYNRYKNMFNPNITKDEFKELLEVFE